MKSLFHYCSNEKCFNILKTRTIRMSDIQKSNDYNELNLLFPRIYDKLLQQYIANPFPFKYDGETDMNAINRLFAISKLYWQQRFDSGDFSNFVLCFSQSKDCLSQWRGYADNAQGCCLEFDFDELIGYCNSSQGVLRLEEVVYLVEEGIEKLLVDFAKEIIKELKGLRKFIVDNMTLDDENKDTDGLLCFNFDGMLENAFIESLKYKSFAFQEEREWRMFFSHPPFKEPEWLYSSEKKRYTGPDGFEKAINYLNGRIDFMATANDIVPFCPIGFDEFSQNPLRQVWIGPKNMTRESDLMLLLQKHGYTNVSIEISDISYR